MVGRVIDPSPYAKVFTPKYFRLMPKDYMKPKQPKNYKKALDRAKRAVLSLSFPFSPHIFFDLPCSRRRRTRTT